MPEDVKIPIETPGGERAKRTLREVAEGERRVGREAEQAGRKGSGAARRHAREQGALGGALRRTVGQVKAWLAGYAGLAGVQRALAAVRAEHERMLDVTIRHAKAMRGVLALSALQGERPETIRGMYSMAARAGRPIEEVSPAYYTLLGGTAGMARPRQEALMRQALLMARTDLRAPLEPMVGLMSTIGVQQPKLSPRQIGNLVSRTIEQAKSTPGEMAAYLPDIMTTGQAAGADPATLAAMFAFATRRGGGVAKSGTAVRSALLGLLAPGPQVEKQLAAAGMPGGDVLGRLRWLGAAGADLPPELIAALGGRRGIQAVSTIAAAPAAFGAEVAGMRGALGAPGSLLEQRLRGMYGETPGQRYVDQIDQLKILQEEQYARPEELKKKARLELRKLLYARHPSGLARWLGRGMEETVYWATGDLKATDVPALWGMEAMLGEGYQPADIVETVLPELERVTGGKAATWRPPAGRQPAEWMRARLRAVGAEPMQGSSVQVNVGGTHYHNHDKREPAGRPLAPAAGR